MTDIRSVIEKVVGKTEVGMSWASTDEADDAHVESHRP